jgi:hypothetical protein
VNFFAILLFAGLIAAIVGLFRLLKAERKRRWHVIAEAGKQWGGRVHKGVILGQPRIDFAVDDIPGMVTVPDHGSDGPTRTRVWFQFKSERRLRLVRESWLTKLIGGTEIQIGDPEFDRLFWIETTDAEWARNLLTPFLRGRLLRLQMSLPMTGDTVAVEIGPGGVMLWISRVMLDDTQTLEQFIDLGVHLLHEVRKIPLGGGMLLTTLETGACPVCGQKTDVAKACPRCQTHHHEECWRYMGGCAVFACAERKRT